MNMGLAVPPGVGPPRRSDLSARRDIPGDIWVGRLKKSSIRDISDRSMNLSVNITRFMLSYLASAIYKLKS